MPFWTRPSDGASAFRPDGIGQNVYVIHLNERSRVVDKSDTQASFADARGRRRACQQLCPFIPVALFTIKSPSQKIYKTLFFGRLKIVKLTAVEAIRLRATITRGR